MIKTVSFIAMALLLAASGTEQARSPAVPPTYRDLYDALEARLSEAAHLLGKPDPAFQPTFAVELTAANGNRGPALLEPQVRQGVIANLEAFKAFGATGVTVAACFPMFLKGFPRSEEYLDFYKFVVAEAHQRGYKVLFKVAEAFHDPVHGHLPVADFYKSLTPERYMRQKREMIEIALRELKPDYLTVSNEPDTAAMNTGLDFSPAHYVEYVQAFTKGLQRGQTKVGAGAGTWSPLEYWRRLAAETDVDYLDLHIYPINRDFLTRRPLEVAELARQHGKSLIIGEGWLYKSRDREIGPGGLSYVQLYARDVFSFWAPLDSEFIRVLGQYSRAHHVEYMSLFWVQYLFGYVEYTPELDQMTPGQLQQIGSRAAVGNILGKQLSPSGEEYRRAISGRAG